MVKKSMVFMAFVLLLCQLPVLAAFSDMEDAKWDWARPIVESMNQSGIIKGYGDNIFGPDKPVTKNEAFVLMSRILGCDNEQAASFVGYMKRNYEAELKKYSTPYKKEIAYLLHRGIVSIDDVKTYISDDVASKPLKRYEVAMLLAKLDQGGAALPATEGDLSFKDAKSVPTEAKAAVAYVSSQGIMLGVEGETFSPMTDVNRAQMAVLLSRMIDRLKVSVVAGTLDKYDQVKDTASFTSLAGQTKLFTVGTVPVSLDGKAGGKISTVPAGSDMLLYLKGDKLIAIDILPIAIDKTVEGIFKAYSGSSDGTVISVVSAKLGTTEQYTLSAYPLITIENEAASIADIKANSVVSMDIAEDKVIAIRAKSSSMTISGKVAGIVLEPEYMLKVDGDDGQAWELSTLGGVAVKKNGKAATLSDIYEGDKVKLTITLNIISAIEATSTTSVFEGNIVGLNISSTPAITIKTSAGDVKEFALLRAVNLIRNGAEADIYSLRLNDFVKVTAESNTVTKIEITSAVVSSSITGKVEYVNTAYGYLKIEGNSQLVFIGKSKFSDNTGAAKTVKDVQQGMNITAFGVTKIGGIEATLVIIN